MREPQVKRLKFVDDGSGDLYTALDVYAAGECRDCARSLPAESRSILLLEIGHSDGLNAYFMCVSCGDRDLRATHRQKECLLDEAAKDKGACFDAKAEQEGEGHEGRES